jgi:hypothetical protein
MAKCCETDTRSPLEEIPAGLSALPRQVAGFPEVRRALLEALPGQPPLAAMRPSGDDLGLMWLEMWAYVADVLGFYDERIANETYLRTAVRPVSLRRVVGLLGYKPTPGVAGSATVAAIADGDVPVVLPAGTRVRSRSFDGNPPQVFETAAETTIHRLSNAWTVALFKRRPTIDPAESGPAAAASKGAPGPADPSVDHLLFEPQGFGLAADDLVLLDSRNPAAPLPGGAIVSRVVEAAPFAGKDGASYLRARFAPPVAIPADFDLTELRVRKPVRTRAATANKPINKDDPKAAVAAIATVASPPNGLRVYLDGAPEGFRRADPVIVARNLAGAEPRYAATTVARVGAAAVKVDSIPSQTVNGVTVPPPSIAATELVLQAGAAWTLGTSADELSFHFALVDGGRATNVARTTVAAAELAAAGGVPIEGIVRPSPAAEAAAAAIGQSGTIAGILEQRFLVADAMMAGALADGRLTVDHAGRATFQATDASQLPAELRLPLTIWGNLVEVTRGESVVGEVLGDGSARVANQVFKLRKKPLTYLEMASDSNELGLESTLRLAVSGVLWREVRSFFGIGPEEEVYVVSHDDEGNAFVTGGDGVRGRRFPTGVRNIVATYRYGSGAAAPPAGAINQLGGARKGLRSVVSPVAALAGKDADRPEAVRANAPKAALLFGRAVSTTDFAAIAGNARGVTVAGAEWRWLQERMQAGVRVRFIGTASASAVAEALGLVADPTIAVEVVKATAIPATMALSVEVDPRRARPEVAAAVAAVLTDADAGVLSLRLAPIGGPFVPSRVFAAVAGVAGVIGVAGLTITTPQGAPAVSGVAPTCLPADAFLDFSAAGAVTVTGVAPAGSLPPARRSAEGRS